jgi:glycosyltransferase involved in cell wall biosynthesis
MKKKILFISHALPPYLYPQSIQIGRFLAGLKKHYDLTVLSADENITPDPTLYPDLYDGIAPDNILRVGYKNHRPLVNHFYNRVLPLIHKRPDLYRGWTERAYQECIARFPQQEFDAIATFSFPLSLNLLGARLKKYYGCQWSAHQSDPWADNPFMHYGPLLRIINNRLEKKCFAQADRLVFTSDEACRFFRKKYPDWRDRISFVDHSFDAALYPEVSPDAGERRIVRYVGGFYGERTARPLLDALAALPQDIQKKLRFEIIGANLKTRLMIQGAGLSPDLIAFTGRVNYAESLALMKRSDALLVIDAPIENNNIFFPSKLADYIGAGRPMIGISSPGPTDRILKSMGQQCFRHDQVRELVQAFTAIASEASDVLPITPVRDLYRSSVTVAKLAEIIDRA